MCGIESFMTQSKSHFFRSYAVSGHKALSTGRIIERFMVHGSWFMPLTRIESRRPMDGRTLYNTLQRRGHDYVDYGQNRYLLFYSTITMLRNSRELPKNYPAASGHNFDLVNYF
ncbi:hypothetical protein FisN_40Hu011 [Fistulifera solaris]|uniref:Uncharacterized protein n=1 Tax=Fistulifera solaris TaxID=1519565 RepID=A0A1Z5K7N3_FISSO|nr:hypothetical protein FisN_40Hu011 [Fistulifera solaris]|eukprot:GAX21938.1 hypothetical protein FisN_40Hu011 [Fistulifera solaris]